MQDTKVIPTFLHIFSFLLAGSLIVAFFIIGVALRDNEIALFAVGGIIALATAVIILYKPEFGAYILIFTIFTNLSTIFTEKGLPSINKPLVILVIFSLVLNYFLSEEKLPFRWGRNQWFIFTYLLIWTLSVFIAKDRSLAADHVIDFAKDFAIILAILYALRNQKAWKTAIWLIIICATLLSLLNVLQTFTGNYEQTFFGLAIVDQQEVVTGVREYRLGGPIDAPNFWGMILTATLTLAVYRVIDEKNKWIKIGALGSAVIIAFAIANTYSRGAFLAMALILVLIAIERRARPTFFLLAITGVILLLLFLPQSYSDRIQSLMILGSGEESSVYEDESFRGRLSEMRAGINMFSDHPFLGVGIGNYNLHYQDYARQIGLEYRTEDRDAHSLYVEILAETGLAGIIAFSLLFLSIIFSLFSLQHKFRTQHIDRKWASWLVSLQMAILAYLFSSTFLHGDFFRYMWLFVALAIAGIHFSGKKLAEVKSV
jgi:O-antigen ligase